MPLAHCPLRLLAEFTDQGLRFGNRAIPPEDKARLNIDSQLATTGWIVQDARPQFLDATIHENKE